MRRNLHSFIRSRNFRNFTFSRDLKKTIKRFEEIKESYDTKTVVDSSSNESLLIAKENREIIDTLGSTASPYGEAKFTAPGTYSFTIPAGVTKISAVCIGGGAGGNRYWAGSAGNGGALAYANNITVKAGDVIKVYVGAGGSSNQETSATNTGGDTYITISGTTIFGAQGGRGSTSTRATRIIGKVSPSFQYGGIGGNGGNNQYGGGGGAGGYTSRGGDGYYNCRNNLYSYGGAGAGGMGYESSTYGFGGGGGAGLYGLPKSNSTEKSYYLSNDNTFRKDYGGLGGYRGVSGMGNADSSPSTYYGNVHFIDRNTSDFTYRQYAMEGGRFGGGGAGGGTSCWRGQGNYAWGASGGCRIIWGEGRTFPYNAE
jgi:hypothetical protein